MKTMADEDHITKRAKLIKELKALREKIVASGEPLLTIEEINDEVAKERKL